ncbi:probable LRR receptor-like serine/threonine-protein kinase At1g56140 [Pyrus communis]|uniref:probable LRR receptor-like serine/threonine-protein kinase At1g56140 n=1 Tax=Pyrus communis TaxID=23211 RepID=UPI0035BFD1F7
MVCFLHAMHDSASRNTSVGSLNSRRRGEQVLHMYNMKIKLMMRILLLCFLSCFWFQLSSAQNATTDPSEVRALNSIFEQWDTQAVPGQWNISGEPCSGSAINGTDIFSPSINPAIVCNCSYDNNATCHITNLKVYALNKRGVFPEEFVALRYLTYLRIDQNYFTGPLPAFIGNMSALTHLYIDTNSFSGPIPKELGNLKELTVLNIGSNNFSGTLPPELGNLVKLKELRINQNYFTGPLPAFIGNMSALTGLYIQFNPFSGPIPKELGNLKELTVLDIGANNFSGTLPPELGNLVKLEQLWASDNPFSGKIPDFIGNWTQLTSLRFRGNSFEGPIPTSFSQLISLKYLRIGDIYNGSSSLDFIKNMKNLTELNLRNTLITGTILYDIGEYQSLQTLDLSFNNLTGQLPSSLFNLSSLKSLFLGNNSLSGSLPSQKSDGLQTIDLSYNFLSGSFPEWGNKTSQLNLVVNNFTFDSSNITLPGLNCLQRNFPCNRNTPRSSFSINCGGQQMTGSDGIVYESEYSNLGPATFSVSSTENWAVSNVGSFSNEDPPASVHKTLAQVTGTDVTPALYQTSRMSTGSLRYHGLGLVNGPYTVTLHFAETVYESWNSHTWQSLGRRVFDIYIQGTCRMKDFDISKEAGGVNRAVVRKFNVNVSENYLEIHLFWAGKGACCPLIAAIHATSDFTKKNFTKKSKTGLTVGIAVLVGVVSLLLIFAILYMRRKKSEKEDDEDILGLGPRPYTFSYAELRAATEDFNPSNKLGEGGYGPVYKGTLSDGRVVAVKQLSVSSHQGKRQFVSEIATISAVQHRNLVKLYGCCIEGSHHILVYEYLENKSLDQALFGTSNLHLDWPTRFNILLGTARGLAYLHEESRPRVVHRDVKASNILLDAELSPKISDFGLAKLYDDKKTHISTRVAGTIGYLAPEYALFGHLTEKADVFGFGVVVLEILSGRPNSYNNLDPEKIYLLEWVWTLHENDQTLGLVDPRLTEFDETEATRLIRVALMCTQGSPMARPSMSRVVAMLFGDIDIGTVILKPSYLTDYDFKDVTTSLTSRFLVEVDTPSTSSKGSNVRLNYQSGGSNASGVSVNVTQITAS